MYICGYTAHDRYIQMYLASFPGSPSFCAIIPRMMFAPLFHVCLLSGGSNVIREIIARKEGEPGNEAIYSCIYTAGIVRILN